jgi:hypothetical protein
VAKRKKSQNQNPKVSWSGTAVSVSKIAGKVFEHEAVAMEIVDGVVIAIRELTRAPDLPLIAINRASAELNKNKGQINEKNDS